MLPLGMFIMNGSRSVASTWWCSMTAKAVASSCSDRQCSDCEGFDTSCRGEATGEEAGEEEVEEEEEEEAEEGIETEDMEDPAWCRW